MGINGSQVNPILTQTAQHVISLSLLKKEEEMCSFIVWCLFLLLVPFILVDDVNVNAATGALFPTSSFIVYPLVNDTSLGVPVLPLSTNLTVTLNPIDTELLGNITIYPINLDTTIDTSELPLCYYNLNSLSFSISLSLLELILPASGYNITYNTVSLDIGKSGLASSLVFVSTDANSTTILVTSDSEGDNTWSRHFSRNAASYTAGSILGLLLLTLFGLAICSLYTDPSCYPQGSAYYPYPYQQQPLVEKQKKKKKKKSHSSSKKKHNKRKEKKRVARDESSSSSSSSSSDSDSDDGDSRA